MKTILKVLSGFLTFAALVAFPLVMTQLERPANAAIALQTPNTCTPDQIVACVNQAITGVNNGTETCTASGCQVPTSGPNGGAVPVITLTCATAGGGSSSMLAGSNNAQGRVTCTSTANTTATLTWATARGGQPSCVIVGETTPVLTITANSTTALSWTYASTVSPIFDYACNGQ